MAPNPKARDFKIDACVAYANTSFSTTESKNPALALVTKALRFNVARVRHLMVMPAVIGHEGIQVQQIADVAEQQIMGALSDPNDPPPADVQAKITERWAKLYQDQIDHDSRLMGTPDWDKHVFNAHKIGSVPVNMLSRAPDGTLGFDVMLASFLIGAWTAFETMAGDLWEAAVNSHPECLAHLDGVSKRIGTKEKSSFGPAKTQSQTDPKAVDLDLIQFHKFDIKEKMGTILRAARFELSRLSTIREAYSRAFSKNYTKIDSLLSSGKLDALSVMRNIIVHKASFADQTYLRNAQRLNLPIVEVGKPIVLDGEIVVKLIDPVFDISKKLIEAVDEWMIKN